MQRLLDTARDPCFTYSSITEYGCLNGGPIGDGTQRNDARLDEVDVLNTFVSLL